MPTSSNQSNKSSKTDEDLLLRIQNADRQAFAILVQNNSDRYYAIAYRMLANKEEAEDTVQNAFLKLWQAPEKWDPTRQTKFGTWFYRVVINLCLDLKKKRRATSLSQEIPDNSVDLDAILDQKTKSQKIEEMIQALPERQQIALNLCFYQGLTNKEAAEIMDINIKALESLIMRAKTKLKTQITEEVEHARQ